MRHPEYEGRSLSVCAEREPSDKPDDLAFACTLKMGHQGDHKATVPSDRVLVRWSQPTRNTQ